jgi:hypothetical protein
MLESQFVKTSALIADTEGVSPLAQKINPKQGESQYEMYHL